MTLNEIMSTVNTMLEMTGIVGRLFFLTLLFSLPLGMILCLGRLSKLHVLRWLIQLYLLVMRGTPLLLQLAVVYFGIPAIFKIPMDRNIAAVAAMSLNYAAYFAEIFRSGLSSIPVGQQEAAVVLGLSKKQTFFKIVLPQVIKRVLPPMSSEFMTLVKDTALVSVIGIEELYTIAKQTMCAESSIIPIAIAGLFYLVMNGLVALFFHVLERKLSYYQ